VLNNASAINLSATEALELKRYDLMQSINARGTFAVSRACIPHLCSRCTSSRTHNSIGVRT
jgi:citronellol/citronellal dehydrogenase